MADSEDVLQPPSDGLDRAPLHGYDEVEINQGHGHLKDPRAQINEVDSRDGDDNHQSGPLDNIRHLSKKLKSKFHKPSDEILSSNNDQRRFDTAILAPTLAPDPSKADNDARFGEKPPEKPSLPPLKDFISSPLKTAKSVAQTRGGNNFAESMAKTDISHGASVNLVRAYDKIGDATTDDARASAVNEYEELKRARQDTLVRWTLDRHVNKVGRIVPHRYPWKERNDFMQKDEQGKSRMQWKDYGNHLLLFYLDRYAGRYIGASSDLPDPSQGALTASFERVLLTSTPLQNLVMKLRRIAHWDDPWESTMYLIIYFTLLIYSYITRAIILLALFMVLKRRFFPPNIEDMRSHLKETEDLERTSQDMTELIDAHGVHGWVDPLIEQAGSNMLTNLEDLANVMEIFRNFFEWRDPHRTAVTLTVLVLMWLMITLTPVHILVHESFFAIGVMFFGLTPIAKRFPQYRLLLSPTIWLFWKIPTHAEWAIARVQAEATQRLEAMRDREDPSHPHRSGASNSSAPRKEEPNTASRSPEGNSISSKPNTSSKDQSRLVPLRIARYHCMSGNSQGNLCISTHRVSFEMHLTAAEKWTVNYDELKSMEKLTRRHSIPSGDDLRFVDEKGNEFVASGLKARDEVFTQIIGYSDVKWQRTG